MSDTALTITDIEEKIEAVVAERGPSLQEKSTFLARSGLINSALRGKPADVAVVLLAAKTYGIDDFPALQDGFDIISGKLAMKAIALRAIVQKSPVCEYFRKIEESDTQAVWETKRRNHPEPDRAVFTLEDAKKMGYLTKDNWKRQASVMLSARASSKLCRQVYADLLLGISYSSEELEDMGGGHRQAVEVELEIPKEGTKAEKLAALLAPEPVVEEPEPEPEPEPELEDEATEAYYSDPEDEAGDDPILPLE